MFLYFITDRLLETSSAVLRVTGPDSNRFLQGQFTQNIRKILDSIAYGLWLNHKGKVVADSFLYRVGAEDFLLVSLRTPTTVLRQRLEAYLIADDVTVTEETSRWAALALVGDDAATVLGRAFDLVPPAATTVARLGMGWVAPARFSRQPNFLLLGQPDEVEVWRQRLEDVGVGRDRASLEAERLRSGIPAVPDDVGPDDLPQEGGLETAAISFTKGCFLGQEVMARLKNLGQVRRRLHQVRGTGAPPAARTAVRQQEQKIGETRSAAADGDGFVALAMLSLVAYDASRPATLDDGRPLVLTALPEA